MYKKKPLCKYPFLNSNRASNLCFSSGFSLSATSEDGGTIRNPTRRRSMKLEEGEFIGEDARVANPMVNTH